MSLLNHPLWAEIRSHVIIEKYAPDGGHKNPRRRLEIRNETAEQRQSWIKLSVPCVACGKPIHPIRERKGGGSLFIATTCPLNVNIACSRGHKAHDEYLAIRQDLETMIT